MWMHYYERLDDVAKSATSSSTPVDSKTEKAFRRKYCEALMRLTNRLTFVLDRVASGLMSEQMDTVMEMMPRAVQLLNTIAARIKHAKTNTASQAPARHSTSISHLSSL